MTTTPGSASAFAAQQREEARATEARLREQARQFTAANRFRSLAAAAAQYAIDQRLAKTTSQTR